MHFPCYSCNIQEMNNLFKKFQDNPVDHEKKKPKGEDHKRKPENLQNRTNDNIQKSKDNPSSHIELPTTQGNHSGLSDTLIGEKVSNSK